MSVGITEEKGSVKLMFKAVIYIIFTDFFLKKSDFVAGFL